MLDVCSPALYPLSYASTLRSRVGIEPPASGFVAYARTVSFSFSLKLVLRCVVCSFYEANKKSKSALPTL